MKMIKLSMLALGMAVTMSCNNSATHEHAETTHEEHMAGDEHMSTHQHDEMMEEAPQENEAEQAKTGMDAETAEKVTAAYLALKTGLVKGDPAMAQGQAQELEKMLKDTDDELGKELLSAAQQIAATQDIEKQREAFEDLSNGIYQLANQVEMETPLYWQHCPMAFQGKGANWISDSKSILNPYFGDRMLKCGKVTETIN